MLARRAIAAVLAVLATAAAPAAAGWLLFYTGVAIETRGAPTAATSARPCCGKAWR